MPENAFIGKPEIPTEAELSAQLGRAKTLWDSLVDDLAGEVGADLREWKSSSRKTGWLLRLKRGERAIVYLSPCRGCFVASFALGDRAMQAAREAGLPKQVLSVLAEAKRYAEGTGVRLEVRTARDAESVKKLAAIKVAH
ncbi:MAG: DUF3788 domain-containing protein [Acidobacteriia bacterium]|nr:DUF3788 domain-containing protein [Terriglobia bacterium]